MKSECSLLLQGPFGKRLLSENDASSPIDTLLNVAEPNMLPHLLSSLFPLEDLIELSDVEKILSHIETFPPSAPGARSWIYELIFDFVHGWNESRLSDIAAQLRFTQRILDNSRQKYFEGLNSTKLETKGLTRRGKNLELASRSIVIEFVTNNSKSISIDDVRDDLLLSNVVLNVENRDELHFEIDRNKWQSFTNSISDDEVPLISSSFFQLLSEEKNIVHPVNNADLVLEDYHVTVRFHPNEGDTSLENTVYAIGFDLYEFLSSLNPTAYPSRRRSNPLRTGSINLFVLVLLSLPLVCWILPEELSFLAREAKNLDSDGFDGTSLKELDKTLPTICVFLCWQMESAWICAGYFRESIKEYKQ